jgi:hypothetical protein
MNYKPLESMGFDSMQMSIEAKLLVKAFSTSVLEWRRLFVVRLQEFETNYPSLQQQFRERLDLLKPENTKTSSSKAGKPLTTTKSF